MLFIASRPPKYFKITEDVNIEDNLSLSKITDNLYLKNIIKSPFLFKITIVLLSGQRGLYAGDYRFTESQNLFKAI